MKNLKPKIEYEGQRYVDDPIYQTIMPTSFLIVASLADAFGSAPPQPLNIPVGHERVRLRWMELDGKGGLVPKYRK